MKFSVESETRSDCSSDKEHKSNTPELSSMESIRDDSNNTTLNIVDEFDVSKVLFVSNTGKGLLDNLLKKKLNFCEFITIKLILKIDSKSLSYGTQAFIKI